MDTSDRKLYEYQPAELDIDLLLQLQGSLMAKLITANKELIKRYTTVTANADPATRKRINQELLDQQIAKMEKITTVLEYELSQLVSTGKLKANR